MERDKYFKYLADTSSLVIPLIKEQVELVCKNEVELKEILMLFYEKRFNNLLLKPALFRISYEICGGENFEKILPIAAAFEVLNISSYQANSSFDNKIGVLSKEEKDSQFIAAMISREISDKLINQCVGLVDHSILNEIKSCISKSNIFIYKAQHYDLNLLSKARIDYFNSYTKYLSFYTERCYLGSGVFSGQCSLAGAIAAKGHEKEKQALVQFAESYGTALHIINDLADFFPGEERRSKLYQDDFSDFKNGRLTLPLFLLLTSPKTKFLSEIIGLANKNEFTATDFSEIQKIIIENGIADSSKILVKELFIDAKKHLEIFEETYAKHLLLALLSVLESNKFYHRIKLI